MKQPLLKAYLSSFVLHFAALCSSLPSLGLFLLPLLCNIAKQRQKVLGQPKGCFFKAQ
jgi:hypothetical protein